VESAGRANKCWALFTIVITVCSLSVAQPAWTGSIVGWGSNNNGQATPPDGNDFVAIAAGAYSSLALKSDGSIIGWGSDLSSSPPDGNDFIAIATGWPLILLGLRSIYATRGQQLCCHSRWLWSHSGVKIRWLYCELGQ
jgi:hypothetical protein